MKTLLLASLLALAACARQTPRSVADQGLRPVAGGPTCPMSLRGSMVSVGDEHGGAGLFFTTRGGDVEELRARVRGLARRYEERGQVVAATPARPTPGLVGAVAERPRRSGGMPATEVVVEEIPGGADVVLTARDPQDIERLRRLVRADAHRLERGDCQ